MNLLRFGRIWREAMAEGHEPDSLLGPWSGYWESEGGHRGDLRCVVQRVGDDRLHAAFHATFWKIFRVTYSPRLDGRRTAESFALDGSWRLGPFSGEFHYEGAVTPERFEATYRSSNDSGRFLLTRP